MYRSGKLLVTLSLSLLILSIPQKSPAIAKSNFNPVGVPKTNGGSTIISPIFSFSLRSMEFPTGISSVLNTIPVLIVNTQVAIEQALVYQTGNLELYTGLVS